MLATIPITKTSASRLTPELRDNAAFGAVFSDHMLVADFVGGKWAEPRIMPYGAQPLAAAPACAHYGQGIFEGFKAFPRPNGGAVVFRPDANYARMAKTCQRMAMPEVPKSIFIDGTLALVQLDRNWIPEKDNSALYVRPVLFATGETLGVKPSESFRFVIETCPSAPYFTGSVDLIAEDTYVRAFPGGTGAAKCGGNYAASLVPHANAVARGHDQVCFLDAAEHRWVEELGGMNVFFVFDDGRIVTPPLTGTILPGITRDSLMTLAREEGLDVREERYGIDQWRDDAASGRLVECFACGTAAVVTPIGRVAGEDGEFTVGSGGPGQLTGALRAKLVAIQRGTAEDRHGWVTRVG
jgi:branched-chain amino acid aminotransferase